MASINFPESLYVMKQNWGSTRLDTKFESVFGTQSVEVNPPLWSATLESDRLNENISGAWSALIMQLKGQTNQLALWNFGRPVPIGTMRGTMTFNTTAIQGATTLSIIAATEGTKTLKAGDYLGFGGAVTQQVVMVMADATADSGGIISVTVQPPLRNEMIATTPITWDKPTVLFRQKQGATSWEYTETFVSGFSLDLIEDWRS